MPSPFYSEILYSANVLRSDGWLNPPRAARLRAGAARAPARRPRAPATGRAGSPRGGSSQMSCSASGLWTLHKGAVVVVEHVGVRYRGVLVIAHHPSGGVVGEQVIHRGGHLEGALVAVALYARDPLRVARARAHHAADLLRQRAQARRGRIAVIAEIHPRLRAAENGARPPSYRPGTGSSRRSRADRARGCPGFAVRDRCQPGAAQSPRGPRRRSRSGRRRSRPSRKRRGPDRRPPARRGCR